MKKQDVVLNASLLISSFLLILLFSGCTQSPQSCPPQPPADLSGALAYAEDSQLEFQFPLDELGGNPRFYPAIFCSHGGKSKDEYHAAEDYFLPAGTPVYAFADGKISFSGRMGGYGWLIIIDHPQANIYSLYGHLSPSRWRLESGPVEKGDLIAYLGDPDENGGSAENPLVPHLHFGIRAGQRTDYPGMGEWRWQAGWIKPCPQDVGWLNPSEVITRQDIPPGGFPEPRAGLIDKWGVEIALVSVYIIGGVCVVVSSIKKNSAVLPAVFGGIMIIAGWVFSTKATRISYGLYTMAALLIAFAILQYVRHSKKSLEDNHSSKNNRQNLIT